MHVSWCLQHRVVMRHACRVSSVGCVTAVSHQLMRRVKSLAQRVRSRAPPPFTARTRSFSHEDLIHPDAAHVFVPMRAEDCPESWQKAMRRGAPKVILDGERVDAPPVKRPFAEDGDLRALHVDGRIVYHTGVCVVPLQQLARREPRNLNVGDAILSAVGSLDAGAKQRAAA